MLNIFKHKTVETPKSEKPEQEASIENIETAAIESDPNEARVEILIESLTDYLIECKKNGIELTPEMAEAEIEKLGAAIEEIFGKKIDDAEVRKTYEAIASNIEDAMSQKAENKGTILSKLRENIFKSNFAKGLVLSTILFFKFNSGHAANTDKVKDKVLQKTDTQKQVKQEGGDKNTYDATEDFKNTEKKVTIKAGSYFETDKADLKNQSELDGKFDNFFSSINNSNFDKMMSHNWIFTSSSDERKTANWGGSNKNLSDARFEEFKKAFEEAKANHNFSGLSADQVKQILDKPILSVQPAGGETHITDLVNPKTNKNFTEKEAHSLSSDDRQKLLDKCRYANFEVESSMFDIGTYGQFILLVDDSPSMKISKANMANELKYVSKDMPVKVGLFSGGLSGIEEVGSSQAAAEKILNMATTGVGSERALSASIQYLEKIPADDVSTKAMYVATDEGLQDVNKILKLTELAAKTNTTITFLMFYENGSKFIKVEAKSLLEKAKQNTESNSKVQQEKLSKNISAYEKELVGTVKDIGSKLSSGGYDVSSIYDALEKDGIKGSVEEIKKAITEADYRNLKNFEKTYLGKKLVEEKRNLMSDKILLTYMQLPVEQQLDKAEELAKNFGEKLHLDSVTKLTTFEDSKGNKVEIPII